MGSKGRFPASHQRRPVIGPGMLHPDPYGPALHPPHGGFPALDMLPPVEVMEQKLAAQHAEMQKLAMENQRLAATHGTLRQELAAAQHEVQMLHAHIGEMKSEREQKTRTLADKISRMEAELQASDSIKVELQQAKAEAQSLVSTRQDLISKVQQLTRELQMAHSDVQHIPILLSELDGLRQEYQHCRATYEYEKKVYNNHLESLQVMEKNYQAMAGEVEKLRSQLSSSSNLDRRPGGSFTGYSENDAIGSYSMGQNVYGNTYGYGSSQGQGQPPSATVNNVGASDAAAAASAGIGTTAAAGAQPGTGPTPATLPPPPPPPPGRAAYDATRGPSYDMRGPPMPGHDVHRGTGGPGYDARGTVTPGYEVPRGPGHDGQRVPGYEAHWRTGYDGRGANFDGQGLPLYDAQRGSGYDPQKGARYDVSSNAAAPQGQGAPVHNVPYGSATPPTHNVPYGYGGKMSS